MATVLQDPVQMGYDAVRVMTEKLQGKPVPERIEVPETLVTTKNLNEPKIQALLFPANSSALSQLEFWVPLALPVFFVAGRSRQEFKKSLAEPVAHNPRIKR